MYKFIVNTESLDKVVENLVDTIVSEHDIETHKILSRFGHTLTYRQAQIYKSERNMELKDKIRKLIHGTIGHLTDKYTIENDIWVEDDFKSFTKYKCHKMTILNPDNMPIKVIGFKEELHG